MSFNHFYSFLNTINLLLRHRIHFNKEKIGKVLITEDKHEFIIFRAVKVDSKIDKTAIFCVKFLLSEMKPKSNIRFSWLPVPFFIGLPGFQAKLWTLNYKNNYFQGIYQWKNQKYAQKYSKSLLIGL